MKDPGGEEDTGAAGFGAGDAIVVVPFNAGAEALSATGVDTGIGAGAGGEEECTLTGGEKGVIGCKVTIGAGR
jgi:hypothetical protein